MNMCFSIIQQLDINKITEAIKTYIKHEKYYKPYIFMNEETAKDISSNVSWIYTDKKDLPKSGGKGVIGQYEGFPVFVNNALKYGEIEIR